jgi:HK97 family phage portal protein
MAKFWANVKQAVDRLRMTDESVVAFINPDNYYTSGTFEDVQDYENAVSQTYLQNAVVFSCIDKIASSVAEIPWEVAKKNGPDSWDVIDHPLSPVIGYAPNPIQSASEFFYALTAVLLIGGKVYIEKVSPLTGPNRGMPKEFYIHRPDRIYPEYDKKTGALTKYTYHGSSGQRYEFLVDPITRQSNIREIKLFNPINSNMGSPAATSLYREIDTLNSATVWNKSLIENSARTGFTVIVHGDAMTQVQVDNLERHLRHMGHPANAGKSKVIPISGRTAEGKGKLVDIIKDSLSPMELDFNETIWNLAKRVCMGMGVPPQILGIPGESKFANYAEARRVFWEETILRYARLTSAAFNRWIFGTNADVQIRYNIDDMPAFADKRAAIWERVSNASFMTINEKRQKVGLEPVGPEGDVILISAGMLPLNLVAGEGEEEPEETFGQGLEELGLPDEEKKAYLGELAEYWK